MEGTPEVEGVHDAVDGRKEEDTERTYVNADNNVTYVNESRSNDHRVLVTDNDDENENNETTALLIDSSSTENTTRTENKNNTTRTENNNNNTDGTYINVENDDPVVDKQYEPMVNESYINVS